MMRSAYDAWAIEFELCGFAADRPALPRPNGRRDERYIISADYRTANTELYRAYKRFCEENGEYLRSHRRLSQNLQERGFRQMKSGGRYWDGIKLLVSN